MARGATSDMQEYSPKQWIVVNRGCFVIRFINLLRVRKKSIFFFSAVLEEKGDVFGFSQERSVIPTTGNLQLKE